MTRWLKITVRFLNDRYHGLTSNGEKPEWPPSPFRLFQALIAGNARAEGVSSSLKHALLWLEGLQPPTIVAGDAVAGAASLTYVLNNVPERSRTPKMLKPTLLNGDSLVEFVWKFNAEKSEECAKEIVEAARHINALGWGIDLAVGAGTVVDEPPSVSEKRVIFEPTTVTLGSGRELRVPTLGSFESLVRAFADSSNRYRTTGVTRLESAGSLYEPCRYVSGKARPWSAFRLTNRDGDAEPLRLSLLAPLSGMLRGAASEPDIVEAFGQHVVDQEIKGHPKESSPNRVSILPLPTIRDGPTDGRIRRVMLAQSAASDGALCRRLGKMLDGRRLKPERLEDRFPEIYIEAVRERDSVLPFYVDVSRTWASVTPVLLPGYDDCSSRCIQRSLTKAELLIRKAITHAGLPQPAEVELSRLPYWSGALHSIRYQPREKLAHYPRWHVRIAFKQALTGPIAIGAGRHCGFGILASTSTT